MVVIIFQLFLFFSPLSGLTLVFTETNHCIISLEEDDQRKKCAFEGWIDNIVEEGLEEVQLGVSGKYGVDPIRCIGSQGGYVSSRRHC